MTREIWPTTPARASPCPRCRAALVVGQVEGLTTRCDALAVTPPGELAAVLAGRQSFELKHGKLYWRDSFRIRGGKIKGLILVTHKCGMVIAERYRLPLSQYPPPIVANTYPGIPY